MSPHLSIDREAVSAFCQRHHIARLALFGSVLRDDFRADSDVDVLIVWQVVTEDLSLLIVSLATGGWI
jgi:hypothetical protein